MTEQKECTGSGKMKLIDADMLKKELSKAPVWTTLTIIEMIDQMKGVANERSDSKNDNGSYKGQRR